MRNKFFLTLIIILASLQISKADKTKWIKSTHNNFVIYSRISNSKSLDMANELLTAYYLIRDKFFGATESPKVSLQIYLFPEVSEVQNLSGSSLTYAFTSLNPEGITIVLPYDKKEEAFRTALHEFVHLFAFNYLITVPSWFNEGLAEFLAHSSLHKDKWILGLPDEIYINLIAEHKRLIDMDIFISEGRSSYLQGKTILDKALFYAQSWILMHYLINGENGKNLPIFNGLILNFALGEEPKESFIKLIGGDINAFEKKLWQYASYMRHNVPRRVMPLSQVQFNNKIHFIECSEQEGKYIDLRISLKQNNIKKAQEIIENLKANYAKDYFYYLGAAEFSHHIKDYDKALENINEALKIKQNDYMTHYLKSFILIGKFFSKNKQLGENFTIQPANFKEEDVEAAKQIIESLKKVISLNSNIPYAYYLIVKFMLSLSEFNETALNYAKKAIEIMKDENLYSNLAYAYLKNNQCSQAIESQELALKLSRNRSSEFNINENKIKSLEEELKKIKEICK